MTNILIQKADLIKDRADISALMHVLQSHEKTIRPQRDEWSNIESGYMNFLQKSVTEHDGISFLAKDDDIAIGFICGWIEPLDDQIMDIDEKPFGYISEGVVLPDYRGQGVYQSLVSTIEDYFAKKNIDLVRTCSTAGNTGINHFLAKNGYAPYYTCFEKRIG